jgi:hypothetical protein
VAYGFHIVAVRADDEGAVVIWMVYLANSRRSIVSAAGGEGCRVGSSGARSTTRPAAQRHE